MKQTDIKVGGEYAYSYGRYYTTNKCKVLEKGIAGWSGRKDHVRVEILYDNGSTREERCPARRIIQPWKDHEAAVKQVQEERERAQKEQEHKDNILLDRLREVENTLPADTQVIKRFRNNIQRSHRAEARLTLSEMEELLQAIKGFRPVPKDGRRCNQCEVRPALENDYLCEKCRYGVDEDNSSELQSS